MPDAPHAFDPNKFETIHQVGGIRTATFDYPDAGGVPGCRVALVDTGGGLRFTVALDRGGDIVEAHYNNTNLAFLGPNGYKPPNPAYHHGTDWLTGWPGGLVTSCGPQYIGGPREEDGQQTSLHGRHSNTPAALLAVHNPEVRRGESEMRLELSVRDSRVFGPVLELRRTIRCTLGEPSVTIEDEITNLGNTTSAHNWLYHVNFGYPLVDAGTRLVYRGKFNMAWGTIGERPSAQELDTFKTLSEPMAAHTGTGEDGIAVEPTAEADGLAHVGIVNQQRGVGMEMIFSPEAMPRMANWRHLGPAGSYVTALEPFNGSQKGKAVDKHPAAAQWLEAGESRAYTLTLRALGSDRELQALLRGTGRCGFKGDQLRRTFICSLLSLR